MNSLEFIEKEIALNEKFIRYWKQKIEEDKRLLFLSSIDFSELMVKTHQEAIQILQQIKTELEAWETVKEILELNVEKTTHVKITSVDESEKESYILVYRSRGSCFKMYTSIQLQEYETLSIGGLNGKKV